MPVTTGEFSFDDGRIATMLVMRSAGKTDASNVLLDFAKSFGLTARETALLELLAIDGLSLAQCAERLGIGLPTAKTHLHRTFSKTATKRQTELLGKLFSNLLY